MVATKDGFVVINDGAVEPNQVKLYTLNNSCKVTKVRAFVQSNGTRADPYDPEDLALGPDGTLWAADIGDNDFNDASKSRSSIALWKLPASGTTATIYRMTYPDGDKHDAEALLIADDGTPIVITKDSGTAGIYEPTKKLVADTRPGVPLKKVGEFKMVNTGTQNPFDAVGQAVVSGAAKSPDGKKVVIRTYSDAYEFDVTDGDIVKAITTETPRITPLPNEPQGESITYSTDGKTFYTVSEKPDGGDNPKILKYTPYVPPAPAKSAGAGLKKPGSGSSSFLDKLKLSDWTSIIAAIGVVGLVLAIAGIIGIRRARRRREEEDYDDEYDDWEEYDGPPVPRPGGMPDDDPGFAGLRDPQYGDEFAGQYGAPQGYEGGYPGGYQDPNAYPQGGYPGYQDPNAYPQGGYQDPNAYPQGGYPGYQDPNAYPQGGYQDPNAYPGYQDPNAYPQGEYQDPNAHQAGYGENGYGYPQDGGYAGYQDPNSYQDPNYQGGYQGGQGYAGQDGQEYGAYGNEYEDPRQDRRHR